MRLYPPIEALEQDSVFKKISNNNDGDKNKAEKNKDELELTNEFLETLIKSPNSIPKTKIYEIVSRVLKHRN